MTQNVNLYIQNNTDILNKCIESNIIESCLRSLDVTDGTKEKYKAHLQYFIDWLNTNGIQMVSKGEILNYKNYLIKRYSNATTCLKISVLKSFYKYLENEHITNDIVKNIKGVRIAKGFKRDIFTLEQLGFEITDNTPIFLSCNGKRLSPDKISHMWKRFVDNNDIPKYCFHTLRHTGLSIMYEQTGNIVAVSKHARHSRVSTTSDIYLHPSHKIDGKLAEFVDSLRDGINTKEKDEQEIEKEIIEKLSQMILLQQSAKTNM